MILFALHIARLRLALGCYRVERSRVWLLCIGARECVWRVG